MSATLLLDTNVHSGYVVSSTTTFNVNLTTNGPNRIAVLYIETNSGTTSTIASITGGGTWVKRNTDQSGNYELWTCNLSAQQTSTTVTVTTTLATTNLGLILDTFYTSGSLMIPIFDNIHSSTWSSAINNPTGTITTIVDNTSVVGYCYGSLGSAGSLSAGTGFTLNGTVSWNFGQSFIGSEIKNVDTSTGGTAVSVPFSTSVSATAGSLICVSFTFMPPVLAPPNSVTATYISGINGNPGYISISWPNPGNGFVGSGFKLYRSSNETLLKKNGVPSLIGVQPPSTFSYIPWGTNTVIDRSCAYPATDNGDNIYTYYISTVDATTNPISESTLSTGSSPTTFLG